MSMGWILAAALFLPLFPLSLAFNRLVASLPPGLAQALAVLALPQCGLGLLRLAPPVSALPVAVRHWGMAWAVLSAFLYAFRTLSAREIGVWTRLLLSSGLALAWLGWWNGTPLPVLEVLVFGWTWPAAIMLWLVGALVRRLGGAYAGLQGGIVRVMPRMAASLTLAVLALAATPVFPAFFATWRTFSPLLINWVPFLLPLLFFWGWASARLFQDLLFGRYRGETVPDLSRGSALLMNLLLLASLILNFYPNGVG